jgi:hypothetical protein
MYPEKMASHSGFRFEEVHDDDLEETGEGRGVRERPRRSKKKDFD